MNTRTKYKLILSQFLAANLCVSACLAADLQAEGVQNLKARNYAKALECFDSALKEQPNNWQLWQNIGSCQMQLGRNDAAINSLQKSIEIGGRANARSWPRP